MTKQCSIAGTIDITERKRFRDITGNSNPRKFPPLYQDAHRNHGSIRQHRIIIPKDRGTSSFVGGWHTNAPCGFFSEDRSKLTRTAHSGPDIVEGLDDIPLSWTVLDHLCDRRGKNIYVPDVHDEPRYCVQDENTNCRVFGAAPSTQWKMIGVMGYGKLQPGWFQWAHTPIGCCLLRKCGACTFKIQNWLNPLKWTITDLEETQSRVNFFLEHTAEGIYRIAYNQPFPPTCRRRNNSSCP